MTAMIVIIVLKIELGWHVQLVQPVTGHSSSLTPIKYQIMLLMKSTLIELTSS